VIGMVYEFQETKQLSFSSISVWL